MLMYGRGGLVKDAGILFYCLLPSDCGDMLLFVCVSECVLSGWVGG